MQPPQPPFDIPDDAGLAVGLWRGGVPILRRFQGLARRGPDVPVGPRTMFDIASVSKMFTALAVLMLARDGRLSLDDRLGDLLPAMARAGGTVTVRHLLHHLSDLPDYMDLLEAEGTRTDHPAGMAEALAVLARQPAPERPGSRHAYSNTGYFLLAAIIERISGRSHAAFTRERIFAPLGMHGSALVDVMPPPQPRVAQSWNDAGAPPEAPAWTMTGDGQIHATLDDLGRWGGELAAPRVFPDLIAQLRQPAVPDTGEGAGYGYGIAHGRLGGRRTLGHGGGWAGFRSTLLVVPDANLVAAVLTNRGTVEPGPIAEALLGAALADPAAWG